MADFEVVDKSLLTSVDRSADSLLIYDASALALKRTVVNNLLNVTSQPMSISDTQSVTNKTLDNSNTVTFRDDRFTLQDNADTTKQAVFQLSGITTGTTRTYTLPNASSTLVDLSTTQTLTNKTLTSPTINTATISNPTLTTDTVSEFTSTNGVTIDGLNIKDSALNTNNSVPNNALNNTGAFGSSWAWTAFSPIWANLTVNSGTNVGYYAQQGKTVIVIVAVTFSASTLMGTDPQLTLPVTASSNGLVASVSIIGNTGILDSGTQQFLGSVIYLSTTTASLQVGTAAGAYVSFTTITPTVPMTWATNDVLTAQLIYQAA